jgi:hypothetical protein
MTHFRTAGLLLACWLGSIVFLGSSAAQDTVRAASNESSSSRKTLTVVGKVGDEGKSLLTDIDSEWLVSNPEILKGLEGQRVRVRCYIDEVRNRLHVLTLRKDVSELRSAAQHHDSAFRR